MVENILEFFDFNVYILFENHDPETLMGCAVEVK